MKSPLLPFPTLPYPFLPSFPSPLFSVPTPSFVLHRQVTFNAYLPLVLSRKFMSLPRPLAHFRLAQVHNLIHESRRLQNFTFRSLHLGNRSSAAAAASVSPSTRTSKFTFHDSNFKRSRQVDHYYCSTATLRHSSFQHLLHPCLSPGVTTQIATMSSSAGTSTPYRPPH